jgi:hypothetical protein
MRPANAVGRFVLVLLGVSLAPMRDANAPIARSGKEPPVAVERAPFALDEEWTRALVRRDAGTFDRSLAADFFYTENDQVMTKKKLIRAVVAGSDTVESAGNEDMRADVHGHTAVDAG